MNIASQNVEAPRILLVEDELLVRLNAAEALVNAGFEVIEAWNGEQAVQVLEAGDGIQALFTDVRMPGRIDGIELAQQVRLRYPDLPVLVVSGYAGKLQDRLSGFAPPVTFLDKPYRFDDVLRFLRRFVTARH